MATVIVRGFRIRTLVILLSLAAVAGRGLAAPASPPPATLQLLDYVYTCVIDSLDARNDEHWHAGEYAEHVRIARLIAEICPDCEDVYANDSWLMESLERHDEGVAFLKLGISRNPESCDLHFELTQFLFRHKRYAEALPYAEAGVRLNCSWHSWHLLAHVYERLGRHQDAINTWKKTIEKWPDDEPAKANLKRLME